MHMTSEKQPDAREALRDPDALAHLERNLRGAGMPRRTFLAMASAAAGSAALAACGGSGSPTATSAPAATVTKAPAVAPTTAAAATTAPTTGAASAAPTTAPAAAATTAPAATAATGSVAAGSPTTAAATGPESKKSLIGYTTVEPEDSDFNRDLYCGGFSQHMAGLLRYDQDFNLLPELAESYTNSGPVFTFKIRKGASDLSGAKADAANLDQLVQAFGVKAVDDGTLEITGDAFAGLIPNQLAFIASLPSREDEVKKYADAKGISSWTDPGKTGKPVLASGAYQIIAWKHNQQFDFVRNEKYYRDC